MWYELDQNDRLISVSDDWNGTSTMAGAPENTFTTIKYRPLWEFVAGEETQRFLRVMFFLVRRNRRSVTLPYRLNGMPGGTQFRMRIEPLAQEGLLVSHQPDEATACKYELIDYATHDLKQCSQCLRINVDDIWYETKATQDLSQHSNWCVCPSCKSHALAVADIQKVPAVAPSARGTVSKC